MKKNRFFYIFYLFLVPFLIVISFILINYILIITGVHSDFLNRHRNFFVYLFLTIFDIVIFYNLFKYPTDFNIFFKIFLILTLIFTTYSNFNYAISKQFNINIENLIEPTWGFNTIYYGSLSYLTKIFKNSYIFKIPYYTSYGIFIGLYLDSIAFICGLPYYLIHLILPSFLSLAWFFIWLLFVIALIVIPYKKLVNIRNRLSNYFKEKIKGQKYKMNTIICDWIKNNLYNEKDFI